MTFQLNTLTDDQLIQTAADCLTALQRRLEQTRDTAPYGAWVRAAGRVDTARDAVMAAQGSLTTLRNTRPLREETR